jgi:hypothetical protein
MTMAHPLIEQLRFTRSEWLRGLEDVSEAEAAQRFGPINTISWMVGHLAAHEQRTWLQRAQGITVSAAVEPCSPGQPPCSPPLAEMWAAWHAITRAADPYLDSLTAETLQTHLSVSGQPLPENIGTLLRRVTYHYWYHLGESQAVRQMLGHTGLPQYVGRIPPYRPESDGSHD